MSHDTITAEILVELLDAPLRQQLGQPAPEAAVITAAYDRLAAVFAELLPFVPALAVEQLFSAPNHAQSVGMYRYGTVLCATLPDLALLAAQRAEDGRRGSEAMGELVQQLAAALVAVIARWGGGMVAFSGDSLTAFFDAARLGEQHSAFAAAAARELQQSLDSLAPGEASAGAVRLRVQVGLNGGRIFAAALGDDRARSLLVAGRAVNRAVIAQHSGAPGEVVVVGETRAAIPGAQTQHLNNDLYVLTGMAALAAPPVTPVWQPSPPSRTTISELAQHIAALRPYAPHALGAPPLESEFRPVTVVAQDFYVLSRLLNILEVPALAEEDPTIVGAAANLYYTHVQQIVRQFGGTLVTLDTTPSGNRVLALFGAPNVHEDDPQRAVQSAQAITAALPAVGQEVAALLRAWTATHPTQVPLVRALNTRTRQRTGIASGTLFTGVIGTAQYRTFMAVGESIGLATRLMNVADSGSILVSSLVRHAVRRTIATQSRPSITVNDTGAPVPVFAISAARAPISAEMLHRTVALVGRTAEVAQMLDVARAALAAGGEAGRVVAVVSAPGMGKTRLLDEALRIIQTTQEAVTLVRVACESYTQMTSYAVVARLLRQLIAPAQANSDTGAQAAAVQRQLDALVPEWSRFAPLLAPLLNVSLPETALTGALTAEQRRDRLHDLIVMTCRALAQRRPLVIVVDDLHWSDASSRMVLARLAEELSGVPLLLVLLTRPLAPGQDFWGALPHAVTLTLHELPRADSEALLHTLLDGDLPTELEPLIERAHGTPFFLEETVGYLVRAGILRREAHGAWVCTVPVDASIIPAQIEQLLAARLDQLPAAARTLAQVAAVLGQRFPARLLAAVQPQMAAALRTLQEEEVLLPDGETEGGYQFRHALLRDVAYARLRFARRRTLHARAAAAIEQLYADTLDPQRVVVAQHYLQAEQPDRAFPHFLRAAQQAQARYANAEAITLYRAALGSAPWRNDGNAIRDISAAVLLNESLGDVLALTGDYAAARDTYEWLLGLLQNSGDAAYSVGTAALQRKLGSTFEQQGNLDAALRWFDTANTTIARAAPSEAATLEQARVESDTGWVHFRRNDLDEAQQCLEGALAHVAADDHPDERARILNRLGGVAWTRGDMERAQEYVTQSLAASGRSGDLMGQANALNNLSNLIASAGFLDASIQYSRQAVEIYKFIGNRRELAIATLNAGWTFYDHEQYEQAYSYLLEASQVAIAIHDTYHEMLSFLNMGRVLIAMEQVSAATKAIESSLFISLQLHLSSEQIESYVALAEIALLQQDISEASQEYQRGLALATDYQSEEYGRLQRLEAKLALAQGETGRAIELLRANEVLFTRLHNVPEARRTRKLLDETTAQAASGAETTAAQPIPYSSM